MFAGYTFWSLRTGIFGADIPTAPALVITFVVIIVFGVAMELLAFRPLQAASPLAKLAASLGILLTLQAAMLLSFGTASKPQPPVLPGNRVDLLGGHGPARPLPARRDRHRRRDRARGALPLEPVRPRDEGSVRERGLGHARGVVDELAVARQHVARVPGRGRHGRARGVDHGARLSDAAAADRARARGRAVRALHVVRDRVRSRPRARDGPVPAPLLPGAAVVVSDGPRHRAARRLGAVRLRHDRDRDVRARGEPARARRADREAAAVVPRPSTSTRTP